MCKWTTCCKCDHGVPKDCNCICHGECGEYECKKPPKLDLSKSVQTRDGYPVRILCTDMKVMPGRKQTIVGLVTVEEGNEILERWTTEGRYYSDLKSHARDLVNVPPPKKKYFWLVFKNSQGLPEVQGWWDDRSTRDMVARRTKNLLHVFEVEVDCGK